MPSGRQARRRHEIIRAHALGQNDAEASGECRLGVVGLRDATQSDLAHRGRRQNDILGLDVCQFFEDGPRRITETGALLPHLQVLPQNEGAEADEDLGLHAILALMPDRPDTQFVRLDPEGRFGLGKLDVGFPNPLFGPSGDVGAKGIGTL